jgi:endonuclease-3
LVAVVLSAQATDAGVNKATPALFKLADTPAKMVKLGEAKVRDLIKTIGLFRTKAKNVVALSQLLIDRHGGEVPHDREALEALPGVGRKTANVLLGNAFGIPGITVDTHFGRLARRFGWTTEDDPVKVEHEVGALFPRSEWTILSHRLIWHGRRVCHARRPACGACGVGALCPSYGEGPTDRAVAQKLVKAGPFS